MKLDGERVHHGPLPIEHIRAWDVIWVIGDLVLLKYLLHVPVSEEMVAFEKFGSVSPIDECKSNGTTRVLEIGQIIVLVRNLSDETLLIIALSDTVSLLVALVHVDCNGCIMGVV